MEIFRFKHFTTKHKGDGTEFKSQRDMMNVTSGSSELKRPSMTVETEYLYVALALIGFIIVIGSVGNILVIYIVKTTKKLHIISNVFIVNLSICDLLFVSCVLPFNIYTYKTDGWYLSKHLCKFIGFLGYTLTGTIIITITLIAYNRYKLVLDPSGYKSLYTKRNISLMIFCAWVIPVFCLLPALLEVWGRFGYVAMLVTCNLLLDHHSHSYKLFLLVVRAGVPCALIVYYYARIFHTTHTRHKRLRLTQSKFSHTMEVRNHKKEMHLTRMMVIIFLVFILSYFPCTVTGMIDWNTVLSKQFHMFCAITVYVGSALNPMVYGLMNAQFRNAYLRLLFCNKQAAHSVHRKTEKQVEKMELMRGKDFVKKPGSALIDNDSMTFVFVTKTKNNKTLLTDNDIVKVTLDPQEVTSSNEESYPNLNEDFEITVTVN